jgi:hypothetical protein
MMLVDSAIDRESLLLARIYEFILSWPDPGGEINETACIVENLGGGPTKQAVGEMPSEEDITTNEFYPETLETEGQHS